MIIKILKYIFLGFIQGVTEPLPISSSGHISVLERLFDIGKTDLNFEIVVNFGSLLAILLIYKDDIIKLIKNFFLYFKKKDKETKTDFRYCLLIVLGSIPVGIIGLLFKDVIEEKLSENFKIIGIAFLITSLFLFLVRKLDGKKKDKDLSILDSIIIGLTQVVALVPGISRSGATLIGGLFRDLDRETALKYSFMLYIPVSFGTLILGVKDLLEMNNINEFILPYGLGFIVSFIVSYFTLRWFMGVVKKGNLKYFSLYTLVLGLLILIFM